MYSDSDLFNLFLRISDIFNRSIRAFLKTILLSICLKF